MPIDYNSSSFDDMCAEIQAGLDRNAAALKRLGIDLDVIHDAAQTESEKQVQPQLPKFEADRLEFIMRTPSANRTLEDIRYLAAFPDQRREFIMQNGTTEVVDQRFLAGTIIADIKSIDEASRAPSTETTRDELAKGIGQWMKGSEVKPGEFDIDKITTGMSSEDGGKAASAILKALRG